MVFHRCQTDIAYPILGVYCCKSRLLSCPSQPLKISPAPLILTPPFPLIPIAETCIRAEMIAKNSIDSKVNNTNNAKCRKRKCRIMRSTIRTLVTGRKVAMVSSDGSRVIQFFRIIVFYQHGRHSMFQALDYRAAQLKTVICRLNERGRQRSLASSTEIKTQHKYYGGEKDLSSSLERKAW